MLYFQICPPVSLSLLLSADKLASLSTEKAEAAQTNFRSHNHCISPHASGHLESGFQRYFGDESILSTNASPSTDSLDPITLIYTSAALKPLPAFSPWSSVCFFTTGSGLSIHKHARISHAIPLIPVNNKKNPHWIPHPTSATAPFSCSHLQQKY